MSDNFLSRWSRRKLEVRAQEKQLDPLAQPATVLVEPGTVAELPGVPQTAEAPSNSPAIEVALPTEADLKLVEQGGDIKAFLMDKVAPELKNKAFKALFARPEFNVMDGLDIYIDDYSKFIPLSQEDIGKMSMSKQLLSRPDLDVLKAKTLEPVEQTLESIGQKESAGVEMSAPVVDESLVVCEESEGPRVIPDASQVADSSSVVEKRSFENTSRPAT